MIYYQMKKYSGMAVYDHGVAVYTITSGEVVSKNCVDRITTDGNINIKPYRYSRKSRSCRIFKPLSGCKKATIFSEVRR